MAIGGRDLVLGRCLGVVRAVPRNSVSDVEQALVRTAKPADQPTQPVVEELRWTTLCQAREILPGQPGSAIVLVTGGLRELDRLAAAGRAGR